MIYALPFLIGAIAFVIHESWKTWRHPKPNWDAMLSVDEVEDAYNLLTKEIETEISSVEFWDENGERYKMY